MLLKLMATTVPKSNIDYLQLVLSLVGVLGLVFLCFWGLKKLNKRVAIMNGSKMRIIDRVNIGRDGMLLIVSLCGKLMLMSATSQRIEKICDLEMTEEEYISAPAQQTQLTFSEILSRIKNKKSGEKDKDENNDEDSSKIE